MTDGLVIDAHQHIWDKARAEYAWLTDEIAPVNRPFAFGELRPQLAAAGVDATVLVQSADNVEDTALMLECASSEPRVVGVVAWAPLDRPAEAAALLERYVEDPVVVGLRTLIHDLPDPRWLLRDEVQEGLALAERSGLSFDVVAVLPEHLECAIRIGQRHPDLRLVIDHLGHPPLGDDGDARWWDLIAEVARNPNAAAKVSGLYPSGDGPARARTDAIRPVLDHALEHFGAARLLYGGDWPISVLHGGYGVTWESLLPLFDGLAAADRAEVLHGTASRVYRLDPDRLSAAQAVLT